MNALFIERIIYQCSLSGAQRDGPPRPSEYQGTGRLIKWLKVTDKKNNDGMALLNEFIQLYSDVHSFMVTC